MRLAGTAEGRADKLQGGAVVTGKQPENCRLVGWNLLPQGELDQEAVGLSSRPQPGRSAAEQPGQVQGGLETRIRRTGSCFSGRLVTQGGWNCSKEDGKIVPW